MLQLHLYFWMYFLFSLLRKSIFEVFFCLHCNFFYICLTYFGFFIDYFFWKLSNSNLKWFITLINMYSYYIFFSSHHCFGYNGMKYYFNLYTSIFVSYPTLIISYIFMYKVYVNTVYLSIYFYPINILMVDFNFFFM